MNTILRIMFWAVALCSPALAAELAPLPASGKVLLFDHGGIIEGDIERVGEKFRIRHGTSVSTIQAKGVIGLVADKNAALELLKQRAKLNDPRERVRLARWCQAHGMRSAAVAEAEAALALVPAERSLKQFVEEMKAFAASSPRIESPEEPIKHVSTEADPMAVEIAPESIGMFATKIQPILLNACAKCHAGDNARKFKLTRFVGPGNKRALQSNLAATSAFLNREQLSASPLLVKAVSIHGDSGVPPLKDRQTPAYRHLEEWARWAAGNVGAAAGPPGALAPSVAAEAQPLPAMAPPARPRDTRGEPPAPVITTSGPLEPAPLIPAKPREEFAPKPPVPTQPVPGDPFDPALFNQGTKPPKT